MEGNDLEKRLRNSGTAAGLMPKLYETRARKLPNVTYKERIKKLEGLRPKPCETRAKSRLKIHGRNDLERRLRNSGTAAGLMPKPRRIEAQTVRNTSERPMENQWKE